MTIQPARAFKQLALWQFAVTGAGAAAGLHWGDRMVALSFVIGAALMFGNVLGLAGIWWRVVTKKGIAWTALIIVIKYAVLLSTIFYLARSSWLHVASVGLGIASFLIAALLWAVTNPEERRDALG